MSGSTVRPSSSRRSLRKKARRTSIPPAKAMRLGRDADRLGVDDREVGRLARGERGEHAAGEVRRADAVAGEAERVVDRRAVERADLRQMARRDVDRAAPGVGDRRGPRAPGTSSTRWRRVSPATSASTSTRPPRRAPGREPPAAPAERDPAVAGGAEVVHEGARVGDALAAASSRSPPARRAPARSARCATRSPRCALRSGRKPRVAALTASTAAPARTRPPRGLGRHARRCRRAAPGTRERS